MSATAARLTRLLDIVGPEHTLTDPTAVHEYQVDGLTPAAVVRPADADQVAEVVRFARAEKLALVACGSRSRLAVGMPPARYDVAVDMTRLNRIIAYDPGDLTVGVEAGIRVADLHAVLAEKGQHLPLQMPFYERMTIGGTLATGMSGPARQAYGTTRDFTLGLEFVTGEGQRAKSGGRVVKNVTGYDIHKLLIGSLGTLAVVTVANFRTFPLPPAQATFVASFPDGAGALALRRVIAQSPLSLHTLEIASPEMARLIDPEAKYLPAGMWSSVIGASGNEKVVTRHAADLATLAAAAKAASFVRLTDDQQTYVWSRVREFPSLAMAASPAATIVKVNVLPGQFAEVVEQARAITDRQAVPCALHVRAVGIVYVVLLPAALDEAASARLAACASALLEYGQRVGTAMIEWCPTELKRKVNVWGTPRGDFELMRRVKKVFDPDGILSPGRHLGGI